MNQFDGFHPPNESCLGHVFECMAGCEARGDDDHRLVSTEEEADNYRNSKGTSPSGRAYVQLYCQREECAAEDAWGRVES